MEISDVLSLTSGGIENVLQLLTVFQNWFQESHKTDSIDRSHDEDDIFLMWSDSPNYEAVLQTAELNLRRIRDEIDDELEKGTSK